MNIPFYEIEKYDNLVQKLSLSIHQNPELAFKEYHACQMLTKELKSNDFLVEVGVGGLETAFIAKSKDYKEGRSTYAFLAEYDALEGLGHACGHNLIATMSVISAIILSKYNLDANIVVIGTPAEEHGGGKITLLDEGIFENIDYALMVHPENKNQIGRTGVGCCDVIVEFQGQSAHSSEPEKGINALQAIINTYNTLDGLRQTFPYKANVSGVINYGGEAANIIPEYAKATFCIRGKSVPDIYQMIDVIKNIVKGVELQIGAKGFVSHKTPYANRMPNLTIEKLYKKHLENIGEHVEIFDVNKKSGSSDIGNVMQVIPAIHPYIKICENNVHGHTKEFKEAAKSDYAHKQALKAIYALVNLVIDITYNDDLQKKIKEEFNENKKNLD